MALLLELNEKLALPAQTADQSAGKISRQATIAIFHRKLQESRPLPPRAGTGDLSTGPQARRGQARQPSGGRRLGRIEKLIWLQRCGGKARSVADGDLGSEATTS